MGMRAALAGLGILAGLLAPASVAAAPPLIGQWPLDAAPGGTSTPDVSGNGLDLAAPGGINASAEGHWGNAFAPANTVTPTVTSPLLAPQQVTLLAWIKQSGNPGTLRYIAGRGDDGPGTCLGSAYALYSGYPAMPGLRFYIRTASGASGLTDAAIDASVFDGRWHLVAGTYDGAASRLYVDGEPIGTPTVVNEPINYALGGGESFYVDGYPQPTCGNGDWPGPIDEVRVYDRALSAAELVRLAQPPVVIPDVTPPAGPTPGPPAANVANVPTGSIKLTSGAAKSGPTGSLAEAAAGAKDELADALATANKSSEIAGKLQSKISEQEAKKIKADAKVQQRLDSLKFGLPVSVAASEQADLVAIAAAITLQQKGPGKNGKVTTQQVTLPPAVTKVGGGGVGSTAGSSRNVSVPVPVDEKATKAMTKNDVVKAVVSVQAVEVGASSGLSAVQQKAADKAAQQAATEQAVLQQLAKLLEEAQKEARKAAKQKDEAGQAKLKAVERQQDQIEKSMKQAEQKYSAAQQAATQALAGGLVAAGVQLSGGLLPAPAVSALTGCLISNCGIAVAKSG